MGLECTQSTFSQHFLLSVTLLNVSGNSTQPMKSKIYIHILLDEAARVTTLTFVNSTQQPRHCGQLLSLAMENITVFYTPRKR